MKKDELLSLRDQITKTDNELLRLISKRQAISADVAKAKIQHGIPVRDQEREEQLLVKLIKQGQKFDLEPHFVTKLFQVIIENSVLRQQSLLEKDANPTLKLDSVKVAFLGESGSYSHLAGEKFFSRRTDNCIEIGCSTYADVTRHVEDELVDYAVLPIENTTSGSINEVYDQLQNARLSIVGELTQEIKHSLLVLKELHAEIDPMNLKTLYAHPQVFAQCSHLLAAYSNAEVKPCDSTSAAMKKVATAKANDAAAIGPLEGGKLYGLKALDSNLVNQKPNHSRFIIVARNPIKVPLQVPAKTTVIMSTVQTPGALVDALLVFKKYNIALTKLESRPTPGNPWEEMFYIDIKGNIDDGPMQSAFENLKSMTRYFKVLGCYPVEEIAPTRVAAVSALSDS